MKNAGKKAFFKMMDQLENRLTVYRESLIKLFKKV